jgi:microcystin-dependent protein
MKAARQTTGNAASARQYNALRADALGGANLLAHNIIGVLKLPTNASNGNTITGTVNGVAIIITLVSGTPTNANDVKIGASGTATIANILAFLQNPSANNTTQVAASAANQQLLSYLGVTSKDLNLIFYSNNNDTDAPLTSFSATTNISGGVYEPSTLKLFIEPGTYYIGTTQVVFTGSPTGTFTAPSANPRVDLLTVGTAGAIAITQGSESATPTAPTYPTDKIVIAEIYNRVGQTQINDNDNQGTGTAQGYILKDVRPFNTINYINNQNQIQDGVITQDKLANAGTVPTGTVTPFAGGTGTPIAGWLFCIGTAVSRTTYAALFAVIGTTYGAGDGSTTFNLPDLRGRYPIGDGTGAGDKGSGTGTPTGTPLTARVLGQWGGEETHTQTEAEMAAHTHSLTHGNSNSSASNVAHTNDNTGSMNTGQAGSSTPMNVRNPFLVLSFIIKT